MASSILYHVMFFLLVAMAVASDPDITSDFILPPNTNAVNGSYFTFTGMRSLVNSDPPLTFTITKATMAEFPALNGQGVSYAVLEFPSGSVNPPHTHPRGAELLLLIYGSLEVGFVDTANKLYTQSLQPGDLFVFPKGLVHYQFCSSKVPAIAISSFGSANAGLVSVPATLFATGIDDGILTKSFKTDVPTIQKIKAGFASKV